MSTLTISNEPYYVPSNTVWCHAETTKTTLKVVTNPLACKDYIHELIRNKVHNKSLSLSSFEPYKVYSSVPLHEFRLILYVPRSRYGIIKSIKFYINQKERAFGFKPLSIRVPKRVESLQEASFIPILIRGDELYIQNPVLLHWIIALIRSASEVNSEQIPVKEVKHFIQKLHTMDGLILKWALKRKVPDVLMKHHNECIKPLSLRQIYPIRGRDSVSSVHSGYGMVALKEDRIFAPKYRAALLEILKRYKIK